MLYNPKNAKFALDAGLKRFDRHSIVSSWGLIGAVYMHESADYVQESS